MRKTLIAIMLTLAALALAWLTGAAQEVNPRVGTLTASRLAIAKLGTPAAPTVTPQGTTGATTYSYRVSALNSIGETLASTAGTTATGNAALSATNFNRVTWIGLAGASAYKVYGRTSGAELLMATVAATGPLRFDDTGAVTPSGALPAADTSGGDVSVTTTGIGGTSADGAALVNTTAATAGVQSQRSPRLRWRGTGWDTTGSVSRTVDFACETRPINGASVTGQLVCSSSIDGAAYTDIFRMSNSGTFIMSGGIFTETSQTVGTTTRGYFTFTADGSINAHNAADNAAAYIAQRGQIETVATTKTPTELESNETYTNGADLDGLTITMPNDPTVAGLRYHFAITTTITSNSFAVQPGTGETLYLGASACSSITATAKGAALSVMAVTAGSGGMWATTASAGTWTCVP